MHTVPEREYIYLVVAYRELIYPGLYCICAVFVDYHIFRKIRKLKPFVVGVQKGLLGIVVQNLQSVVHVALKAPQIALYDTAGGVDDCREKKEQRCHKGKQSCSNIGCAPLPYSLAEVIFQSSQPHLISSLFVMIGLTPYYCEGSVELLHKD